LQALVDCIPAIHLVDLNQICNDAGVKLTDPRTAAMAGTLVSNAAQPLLARELACHWLPASVFPPIKALVLDLDNTLHAGVLGEDGIQGVKLTEAHKALQSFIKRLRQRGVFIALLSRNERLDVESLFQCRDDYPLRWEDFSVTEISWGDKGIAIERIAKALRIAENSILFVDDNPGELASVVAQLPQVHTVYASPDASLTQRSIEYYPGLWRWKLEVDDVKRVKDLESNTQRDAILMASTDQAEYFRGLQTTLIFRFDPHDQLSRLADLCNKTNQFNLAMRRFSHAELAERLNQFNTCVVSVQMNDRLSDSGVIAVIVAERVGEQLIIEELCISCRALGRQLEDTIILESIRGAAQFADCSEVFFRIQVGGRNQPALDWLARFIQRDVLIEQLHYAVPISAVRNFSTPDGVKLVKE
jgi:FkbH-like protein